MALAKDCYSFGKTVQSVALAKDFLSSVCGLVALAKDSDSFGTTACDEGDYNDFISTTSSADNDQDDDDDIVVQFGSRRPCDYNDAGCFC